MKKIFNHPIFNYHNHAFPKLLAFRIQMVLAYQIVAVVVGWHIYELTRDPLALGLIGLAEVIPYFCFALFAGHAVDHYYSRRLFGVLAALMLFINTLVLVAVSLDWLPSHTLWIYASIAFAGVARAFIAPSYSTLFAIILPREHYARASGIGTSVFQFGLVAGPALGGLLVGFTNKTVAYSIATLLFIGAALTLLSLKIKEPPAVKDAPAVFTSIGQGLRFVVNNQIVFGAQMLDMFAVLFGGAVALLPAFVHEIYHVGPEGLGILRAAPSVGGIIVGVYLTRNPINLHAGRWLLSAVAGFGICIIAFALTTQFWMAAFLL
ncbi:MAG: MFS transporter [Methylophilaceae bacterium]